MKLSYILLAMTSSVCRTSGMFLSKFIGNRRTVTLDCPAPLAVHSYHENTCCHGNFCCGICSGGRNVECTGRQHCAQRAAICKFPDLFARASDPCRRTSKIPAFLSCLVSTHVLGLESLISLKPSLNPGLQSCLISTSTSDLKKGGPCDRHLLLHAGESPAAFDRQLQADVAEQLSALPSGTAGGLVPRALVRSRLC